MKEQTAIRRLIPGLVAFVSAFALTQSSQPVSAQSAMTGRGEPASRFATFDGIKVHYKSYGKGNEVLVFVHGWTCNMNFWRGQVPGFEGNRRVVLVDLPGHGQSDKPQTAYTMDLFARAVDAVLRDANVSKAVLIGHSMGTPVIRQFYRKYPQKTVGLVIVDGALRPFGDKAMMENFIAPLRGPNYKEAAGAFIQGMLGSNISPELRDEIKSSMLSTPQYVAISAMEGMMDTEIWMQDKINVPVLALLAKSPFWPADNQQFFQSLAPHLEYHMIEGVGHFLMMEKPKEINQIIEAFLTKNKLFK